MFGLFGKKKKEATTTVTSGYSPPPGRGGDFRRDLPPFSIRVADMMRYDPKVTIALAIKNGMLAHAQTTVSEGRPEIMEFVQSQWDRIWANEATKMLTTKLYGYSGYEVIYKHATEGSPWDGKIVFDRLKDFHPVDVRPLVKESKTVGLTVNRINPTRVTEKTTSGRVPVWQMKALWLTYGMQYGDLFGVPLLQHAYPSWYEKIMDGGYIKTRQLRMIKDAYMGVLLRYPEKEKMTTADGRELSSGDISRQTGEILATGGIVGFPSTRYQDGNLKWDVTPPTDVKSPTGIWEWGDKLDNEILEALEMPSEVIQAMSSGSGFSGRSIPFMAMLAALESEFSDYLRQVDEQILRPLVRLNFAIEPFYEIKPVSLIDIITEKMGDSQGSPQAPVAQNQANGLDGASPVNGSESNALSPARGIGGGGNGDSNGSGRPRFRKTAPPGGVTIAGKFYPAGSLIPENSVQFSDQPETPPTLIDIIFSKRQKVLDNLNNSTK